VFASGGTVNTMLTAIAIADRQAELLAERYRR
jgi:hypothetical protein